MDEIDAEIPSSDSHLKQPSQGSVQKVYRQGDKIYQVMDENVTMVKNDVTTKTSNSEGPENADEVASGESLHKVFAFDNNISKEETEKCLAFWRSVVEKNLEPLKCSLIEDVNRFKTQSRESGESSQKKSKQKTKRPSKDKDQTQSDKSKPPLNYRWIEIMTELQKRRLHETKLLLEKRCRFCEYLSSPSYESENPAKQNQEMIEDLRFWEPKGARKRGSFSHNSRCTKKTFFDITSRSKYNENSDQQMITPPNNVNDKIETKVIDTIQEENTRKIPAETLLEKIKEESNKIIYVNAIEKKKRNGDYSKWRRNTLETCTCEHLDCDCNINPAIKTIIDPYTSSVKTSKTKHAVGKRKKEPKSIGKSQPSTSQADSSRSVSKATPSLLKSAEEESQQELGSIDNSMTTQPNLPKIDPTPVENTDEIRPSKASAHPDQSDTIRRKLSKDKTAEELDLQQEETSKSLPQLLPSQYQDQELNEEPAEVSKSLSQRLPYMKKSNLVISDENKRSCSILSGHSRKSISVMIACTCGEEKCDCVSVVTALSPDDYRRVMKLVETAILSTDLAMYFKKRNKFLELIDNGEFDWQSDDKKDLLSGMMMTACDVSAIAKPWEVQHRIAKLVADEFFDQGDLEKMQLKEQPIAMMDRERKDELPQMQVGFIDVICLPLYKVLSETFPWMKPLYQGTAENRRHWQDLAEKVEMGLTWIDHDTIDKPVEAFTECEEVKDIELTVQTLHTVSSAPPVEIKKRHRKLCCML